MTARAELNTLEASGLVQVAALEPELEYLFRHALVQDAAYSSLLKQDRRTLHKLAADTLLLLYPERRRELAAVIAIHFERAGDAGAAAEYFVIAGEHALERFANREALAFFERAEASLGPDDPRLDLRMRTALGGARAGWAQMGTDQAVRRLEQTIAAAEGRAEPKVLGEMYFWVAFLRRTRGETPQTSPELRHAVERAASIGAALGDPVAQAIPNAFMAVGMMFAGDAREGARQLEAALEILAGRADAVSSTILAGLLAVGYGRLGDFASAERAMALAQRLASNGDPISALDINIIRSSLLLERGAMEESAALATQCAAESEELGAVACGVSANVLAGAAYMASDDVIDAKPLLERGLELAHVSGMAAFQTLADGMLASVRARLGDIPAGIAGWNLALERAHGMHDRFGEAMTLWQRARARARATPPDHGAALADLDVATALLEEIEARPALARALRDRAETLRELGRVSEADEVDDRSRGIGAELGLKDFV